MTKEEKLKLIYRRTHRDYKGPYGHNRERCILVLREGGTCLVPLSCLTDEEIERKLPKESKS